MAQGTATLNFGAFPGATDCSVAVTGQTGILAGSLVEAWLLPAATADHSADEHLVERIKVMAGNIIAGTGFTIYGIDDNQLQEPAAAQARGTQPVGSGPRVYGAWNVGWAWN